MCSVHRARKKKGMKITLGVKTYSRALLISEKLVTISNVVAHISRSTDEFSLF